MRRLLWQLLCWGHPCSSLHQNPKMRRKRSQQVLTSVSTVLPLYLNEQSCNKATRFLKYTSIGQRMSVFLIGQEKCCWPALHRCLYVLHVLCFHQIIKIGSSQERERQLPNLRLWLFLTWIIPYNLKGISCFCQRLRSRTSPTQGVMSLANCSIMLILMITCSAWTLCVSLLAQHKRSCHPRCSFLFCI